MDEEQINELSQLAEEIANENFDGIEPPTANEASTDEAMVATFLQAANSIPDSPVSVDRDGVSVDTEAPSEEEEEEEESITHQPEFITPNISSSITEEATARFSSADWFEKMKKQRVILAGLGGIGSWVNILLGRCHPYDILLIDNDSIEAVNMAGQLYKANDLGRSKASVSTDILNDYCNYTTVQQYTCRYDENFHPTTNIMICGFDNMSARKFFYHCWKKHTKTVFNPENCLFIDGRLNAEEWQVFAIRGNDDYRMRQYEREWLFEDNDVEEAICSYKQTSYCASMIASFIVNIFTNFVANLCDPVIERDIPFLTEYDASRMYLKTIQ